MLPITEYCPVKPPYPPTLGESNLVKVPSIGDLGADTIT